MFVNRFKIKISDTTISGASINIPINNNFIPIDNSDLVSTEFVEKETQNAINPIIDNEKVKLLPSYHGVAISSVVNTIKIKLWKDAINKYMYSDFGITNDDIRFRRNKFLNSFLRFTFYDSDQVSNQSPLFYITYFTQINSDQRDTSGSILTNSNYNNPLPANQMPVSYVINNPVNNSNGLSEGYYVYWYKRDILNQIKNLYCRVTYNNAVDGKITQFYAVLDSTPPIIDDSLYKKLHIKYILFKDIDGRYKYRIDNGSSSVDINDNRTIINSPSNIIINLYPLIIK